MDLVLASSSPFRREVLERAGLSVRCVEPAVDESAFQDLNPERRAIDLAVAKRSAVPVRGDSIGLAFDQVVYDPHTAQIYGKPTSPEDQVQRLLSMRGRAHDLVNGWCVYGETWKETGVEVVTVRFRAKTTEREIRCYVQGGEARGCAGGYAAESAGSFLIEKIDGDWFSVIGMPLYRIYGVLRRHGWRFGGT